MESEKKQPKNQFSSAPWRVALLKLNLVSVVLQYMIGMVICYTASVESTTHILFFGIMMAVSGSSTVAFYMNFNKKQYDYKMLVVTTAVWIITVILEFFLWLDTGMSFVYGALIAWEKAVTMYQTMLVYNYLYYQEFRTWPITFDKSLKVSAIADFRIEYQKLEICRMVDILVLLTTTVIFAID